MKTPRLTGWESDEQLVQRALECLLAEESQLTDFAADLRQTASMALRLGDNGALVGEYMTWLAAVLDGAAAEIKECRAELEEQTT